METYPLVPNRITNLGFEMKTTVVKFENGVEQRSADRALPIQTFRFYHQMLSVANLKTLTDFFVARKGQATAFYFADYRSGITYTVRFNNDKLEILSFNSSFADVNVEVVTC